MMFKKKKNNNFLSIIVLLIFSVLWISPIIYALSTSFKSELKALEWPINLFSSEMTIEAYKTIFANPTLPLSRWFFNSLLVSSTHTLLALIIFSMAGYIFARGKFKYRDKIFTILLTTMMIPSVMNLVPLYLIVNSLGLTDTIWALVLPGLAGVFNVFLLRQFFLSIPDSLEEAAIIDGASQIQIFFKIMLPLVKPALMVVAIFSFIGSWNDYLWPSIVINDNYQLTLPLGLALAQGPYGGKFNLQMAIVIISFIPILILFTFMQKYIMKGLSASSGVKG